MWPVAGELFYLNTDSRIRCTHLLHGPEHTINVKFTEEYQHSLFYGTDEKHTKNQDM